MFARNVYFHMRVAVATTRMNSKQRWMDARTKTLTYLSEKDNWSRHPRWHVSYYKEDFEFERFRYHE